MQYTHWVGSPLQVSSITIPLQAHIRCELSGANNWRVGSKCWSSARWCSISEEQSPLESIEYNIHSVCNICKWKLNINLTRIYFIIFLVLLMFIFSFMLWDIDQGCWMHYIQHYCDVHICIFRPLSPSIAKILVALKFTIWLQVLYQFLRDSPQTHFF